MNTTLLITEEMLETKPISINILHNWGLVTAVFNNHPSIHGLHCYIEGTETDFINWLKPFDYIAYGVGSPILQQFTIVHVSDKIIKKNKNKQVLRALEF